MDINTTTSFSGVTSAMVSTYVNGTIKAKDIDRVERAINSSDDMRKFYDHKVQEKEFMLQLIPDRKITASISENIKKEIREINDDVYPEKPETLGKKVYRFLTSPIIEI